MSKQARLPEKACPRNSDSDTLIGILSGGAVVCATDEIRISVDGKEAS